MNFERLTSILNRIEYALADVEAGRCDALRLLGQLHNFTGEMCGRACELAGRTGGEWCELGHALRDGLRFAVETGQGMRQELARIRKCLTPLFQLAREAQEVCA